MLFASRRLKAASAASGASAEGAGSSTPAAKRSKGGGGGASKTDLSSKKKGKGGNRGGGAEEPVGREPEAQAKEGKVDVSGLRSAVLQVAEAVPEKAWKTGQWRRVSYPAWRAFVLVATGPRELMQVRDFGGGLVRVEVWFRCVRPFFFFCREQEAQRKKLRYVIMCSFIFVYTGMSS